MRVCKVRIEYDDGTYKEIEGKEAEAWETQQINAAVFLHVHGVSFDSPQWKKGTIDKPE